MHPTLRRLDRLADHLQVDDAAVAVLGVGSAGVEHARFDDRSDIDFFVIVTDPAAKERYLADPAWLGGFGGEVGFSFPNTPDGRKALFRDGLFCEYAVFTLSELDTIAFAGARVVWARDGFVLPAPDNRTPHRAEDRAHLVGELLTNVYVGLLRDLRGEHLSGMRFIQVQALDRVLELVRLDPRTCADRPDPFDLTRRAERSQGPAVPDLASMTPGSAHNREAARAILGWLTAQERSGHLEVDPFMAAAIRDLSQGLGEGGRRPG